jgi:hypothetical protein
VADAIPPMARLDVLLARIAVAGRIFFARRSVCGQADIGDALQSRLTKTANARTPERARLAGFGRILLPRTQDGTKREPGRD